MAGEYRVRARSHAAQLMQKIWSLRGNSKLRAIAAAAIGQVVMFVGMAIVSRHYSQQELAQYGIMFSLFSITQLAASLRLEQGLVYEKSVDDQSSLYSGALIVTPVATIIASIIVAIYVFHNPQTSDHWAAFVTALCAATLCSGLARLHVQVLAAARHFEAIALANILRPSLIGMSQMFAAYYGTRTIHLLIALTASQAIYALIMWGVTWRLAPPHLSRWTDIVAAIRRNWQFPIYSLPQNLVYTASEASVPLALPFLFPTSPSIALFWLASRAVFAPATILSESIRPIIYRDLAESNAYLWKRITQFSIMLSIPMIIGLIILFLQGENLFGLAFGDRWRFANDYAIILGGLVLFNMISLPIVGALPILRLQRSLFVFEVAGLFVRIGVTFLFSWRNPVLLVAAATISYALVMAIFYLYAYAAAARLAREGV